MAISLSNRKHTAARTKARMRRQARGRKSVSGTPERPRMVITRSSKHLRVQLVDDVAGITLTSASTMEADLRASEGDKTSKSRRVGELVARRAKAEGLETVVFDRAGHKFHGRIAALAEGAREGGLGF